MFEGYFSALCGRPTANLAPRCSNDISEMIRLVSTYKDEFKTWGEYDLFRTEREVVSAQALMAAYSWVREGLLNNVQAIIGPMIGCIDIVESLRCIFLSALCC